MPGYELEADFDRNGAIDGSRAERSARNSGIGAILLPNLDADGRNLPAKVSVESPVQLDNARATRTGSDNELLTLRLTPPATGPADTGAVAVTGWLVDHVRLFDQTGRRIKTRDGSKRFQVPLGTTKQSVLLEVATVAGSPLTHPTTMSQEPVQRLIDEAALSIQLFSFDASGDGVPEDSGRVTVAPVLFMDNLSEAERVYVAAVQDTSTLRHFVNQPTLTDLAAALGAARVPLVVIPPEASNNDGWIQDQIEFGYCHAPSGVLRVVLHLPRLRANVVQTDYGASNLSAFPMAHFPSRDIGVFDDFWQRNFPVRTTNGSSETFSFIDSYKLATAFKRVPGMLDRLSRVFLDLSPEGTPAPYFLLRNLVDERRAVDKLKPKVLDRVSKRRDEARTEGERQRYKDLATAIDDDFKKVAETLTLEGNEAKLTLHEGQTIKLTQEELIRVAERIELVHDSTNYGGNIEASPPIAGFPQGKLVVGNYKDEASGLTRIMDPDLLRFLKTQRQQPLVEINTAWLGVAHVDEVMTFVPDAGSNPDFAILLASPGIGMALLREADARFRQGLPIMHNLRIAPRETTRRMTAGTSPVTRMFRGLSWRHSAKPESVETLEPPQHYRRMVHSFYGGAYPYEFPYKPGWGEDRDYPAELTVREFLVFEDGSNDRIQKSFQEPLEQQLQKEFAGIKTIGLPTIYDIAPGNAQTSAYIPNPVNCLVTNRTVVVPRPFGPRMSPRDAIASCRLVMKELGGFAEKASKRLDTSFVKKRELDRTIYWSRTEGWVGEIREIFQEGFAGRKPEEVERKIRSLNPKDVQPDGRLAGDRWRRLILPEGNVDLFELYCEAIFAELGLTVHWADTWFYHVNLGELHCGTNVLRKPRTDRRKAWWLHPQSPPGPNDL